MTSFYSKEELKTIGLKKVGINVKISKKTSIYFPEKIEVGNNVRIDDYCLLSGNIIIKNNVHISAYTALYGGGKIVIGNFSGCSARCTLISASDDFSGNYMVGATIPDEYKNINEGEIILEDYVQLGANTIVLPDVVIGEGTSTGAMTFVNKNLEKWGIYVGIPARKIKDRSKNMLKMVKEFKKNE